MDETARDLVQQMVEAAEWPRPELMQAIFDRGEEAVEPLREVARRGFGEWPADAPLWHAVGLLCSLRAARAAPELLSLFYRYESDDLEGVTDDFPLLGPSIIEPALGIAGDEALDWYARTQASTVAVETAGRDPERRARVAAALREMLAGYVARAADLKPDDVDVVTLFVSDLATLGDPEARPLVEAAFAADIVDRAMVGESVDELYREPVPPRKPDPGAYLKWYRWRYRAHLDEERRPPKPRPEATQVAAPAAPASLPAPAQIINPHKLGRNEPCWCGSGKKYKRCHYDADRKL